MKGRKQQAGVFGVVLNEVKNEGGGGAADERAANPFSFSVR